MAKQFKFGSTFQNGNSALKLVVYLNGQTTPETVYSFDGRMNKRTGKMMIWDQEVYWTPQNGEKYLKTLFDAQFREHPRLLRAFISDSAYPVGQIYSVWCQQTHHWTTQETANKRAYQQHSQNHIATKIERYSFRLSIPGYAINGKVSWKNFYTNNPSVGQALIDLVSQYKVWQAQNPSIRLQPNGQIYGKIGGSFTQNQSGVPQLCFFDCQTAQPRYHRTAAHQACSVVEEYSQIQNSAKDISELISNYTA